MTRLCLVLSCVIVAIAASVVQDNSEWSATDPRWETLRTKWWIEDEFVPPSGPIEENSKAFWNNLGQNTLKQKLSQNQNLNKAKNVIIMIGAGMGLSSQMAARSYIRDVSTELSFEKFPYAGMSKTYCVNYQVPDSASSTTAMLGGVKNNFMVIGLTADVVLRNCTASKNEDYKIPSIFKYAQDAGKSTGFVTTTKVTDSTVAAAYANAASMQWGNDAQTPAGCDDIGKQLVHGPVGSKLDVILGGGLGNLIPEHDGGFRKDGNNLVEDYRKKNKKSAIVMNKAQLNAVNAQTSDKLLGLFHKKHMDFKLQADASQPTLTEMTAKALEVMKKNQQNGYILLVEGGRIDRAHHENQAQLALEEVVEFHKAVEYVKQNTNEEETLIIVTADHGQPFTVGGYIPRGRNILGPADWSQEDNKWVFSASYAQGQGYNDHFDKTKVERKNPQGMEYMKPTFRFPAGVAMDETTHSGEDVGVYASGPYSHLFTGVYEQNFIAHAMMYASCLGPHDVMKNPKCQK